MKSDDFTRGFNEGYSVAIKEYERGYNEGFVAGYYAEDEDDGVERSRAYQLGFARGFVAGNNAYVLANDPNDDPIALEMLDNCYDDSVDEDELWDD